MLQKVTSDHRVDLQGLYDREINFSISTFWDGGFDWRLGDESNGWKAEDNADTMKEAAEALTAAARDHYPGAFTTQGESDASDRGR